MIHNEEIIIGLCMYNVMEASLDAILIKLMEESYYRKHVSLIEQSILEDDMNSLLEYQTTTHNMELEEAYKAGRRDCIVYLQALGK